MTTLTELWAAFTTERSLSIEPTTVTTYRQVAYWLKRCPITDPAQGRAALVWVMQQKPEKAALRVGQYLKTMYRWACAEDVALVAKNPVASFKFPKAKRRVEIDITVFPRTVVDEVMVALKQASRNEAQWHLLAQFMLQTGLRTGEAFAIQWCDIDEELQQVLVRGNFTITHGYLERTKTGHNRVVPLNATAQWVLRERRLAADGQPFVFPWNRQSFMTTFRTRMKRLRAEGVLDFAARPYTLRHTALSRWVEEGVPVAQVAKWAGNSSQMVWEHYAGTTTTYEIPVL
jgi:integrase